MPYTGYKKTKKGIRVSKKGGGGFTAHTQSVKQAKRTARIRESYAHEGKSRKPKKGPRS